GPPPRAGRARWWPSRWSGPSIPRAWGRWPRCTGRTCGTRPRRSGSTRSAGCSTSTTRAWSGCCAGRSRDSWSPSSGDHLSRGERSMIRTVLTMTKRTPLASRGMVVAEHPIGAQVGASILARGGNAVDAAVATAFAMPVVEPFMSSIAGGASFLIHMARRGETVALDPSAEAPAAAPEPCYELGEGVGDDLFPWRRVVGDANTFGPRSVAVPGSVAGLALGLGPFGTRPRAGVL